MAILDYIKEEWSVFRAAPVSALIFIGIGISIAGSIFEERMAVLNTEVSEYRERLGLTNPSDTAYSKLTNSELKQQVYDLTPNLHAVQRNIDEAINDVDQAETQALKNAKTTSDQLVVKQNAQRLVFQKMEEWQEYYEVNYRTHAALLRDEMLKRIPSETDPSGDIHVGGMPITEG